MEKEKYINKSSFGTELGRVIDNIAGDFGLGFDKFDKLKNIDYDFEEENERQQLSLYDVYMNITDILRKYCDLQDEDYPIIATWIIGTYFHNQFESYPYLFLNAMKGSGKTRTVKLITDLSKDGEILLQPTEAVLFRTRSTLGIDEAEGITRKGMENLRELLNGCYKKGTKVKRMKQKKTIEGVEQVVEEFEIYRPLVIANINGMEDVLGDRCINIVLERSTNPRVIKLAEIWKHEKIFQETKKILESCSFCSVVVVQKLYTEWNKFIIYINNENNYNNYMINTSDEPKEVKKSIHNNYINYTDLFEKLYKMDLTGREVELCMPLLYISSLISENVFEQLHNSIQNYMMKRKEDQFNESRDISVIDYVSQEIEYPENEKHKQWLTMKEVTRRFLEFTNDENKDGEINNKWMGWALRRLKLIKLKERKAGGIRVILDIKKAQEKIIQFK